MITIAQNTANPDHANEASVRRVSRRDWLSKKYQDSIGLTKNMADSIVSVEISTTKTYDEMLSNFNRDRAMGIHDSTPPNLTRPFLEGKAKIRTMLTPAQFEVWQRMQLRKYNGYYKRPATV